MAQTPATVTSDVLPKATLFCPTCGHQSTVDGDWKLVQTKTATRYLCPDCGTELTSRSRTRTPDTGIGPLALAGATADLWGQSLRAWQSLWLRLSSRSRPRRRQ